MIARIISTILLVVATIIVNLLVNVPATLVLGQNAGRQFEASDQSYLVTQALFRTFNGISGFIWFVTFAVILLIWLKPIRKVITTLITILALFVIPQQSKAYYDKSDYSENYFVLPNESAFFVPDVGDNKSSQASFGSEAYLSEKKIAAKRFEVPHTKLPNSGVWSNFYVPAGRLIIVDRTPVSREWVKAPHRGTDKTDQSFPCQSAEGLDITVGIAVGASVFEENAAKFLFRFGVNPPVGDRNDPVVIFTSVYYGKSLAQVMDGPVRSKVQSLVCDNKGPFFG